MPELPDGMGRNGREIVPVFDAEEKLFVRVQPDHLVGGCVRPEAFRVPCQSCNREQFSEPDWVLSDWGVVYVRSGDVPPAFSSPNVDYNVDVEHVPLETNYSHSEIRVRRGIEPFLEKLNVSRKAGLDFKARLARMASVAIPSRE